MKLSGGCLNFFIKIWLLGQELDEAGGAISDIPTDVQIGVRDPFIVCMILAWLPNALPVLRRFVECFDSV